MGTDITVCIFGKLLLYKIYITFKNIGFWGDFSQELKLQQIANIV